MTYSEKLKDPRWQRKRLEIMQRDGFTCRYCHGDESTLHVHHSFYRKGAAPWDYESQDLVTLCADCHEEVESERDELLRICAEPYVLSDILRMARAAVTSHGSLITLLTIALGSSPDDDTTMIMDRKECAKAAIEKINDWIDNLP